LGHRKHGSTGHTDDIVKKYLQDNKWIEFLRMPDHSDRHFAVKVTCFNAGSATLRLIRWSGSWVVKNVKRQEAKGMVIRYAETLALLAGVSKPKMAGEELSNYCQEDLKS
jgi:hypothetical protein